MSKLSAVATVFVFVATLWASVTALLFAMWWSAAIGGVALAALIFGGERRHRMALIGGLAAPLVVLQVSIVELAAELDTIACEVDTIMGEPPARCDDLRVDLDASGPLLNGRQHLAIRWLNLQMAVGGWFVGFREVAWETLALDWSSTPRRRAEVEAESFRKRRRYCQSGAGKFGPTLTKESDFAMDDRITREAAARLARQTRDGQERWERVRYTTDSPWHVWLALLVPDSRIHARRDRDRLHMWYSGSIQYPSNHLFAVRIPRPIGRPVLLVADEAIFCGLQMDGVFVPYQMEWTWTMSRDDRRLQNPEDAPRFVERLLR